MGTAEWIPEGAGRARIEIFDPEAEVVREIFAASVGGDCRFARSRLST